MPKDKPLKRIYSIGEAASFLGVSIDTLRNWEVKGKITPIKNEHGTRKYFLSELKRVQKENPKTISTLSPSTPSISPIPLVSPLSPLPSSTSSAFPSKSSKNFKLSPLFLASSLTLLIFLMLGSLVLASNIFSPSLTQPITIIKNIVGAGLVPALSWATTRVAPTVNNSSVLAANNVFQYLDISSDVAINGGLGVSSDIVSGTGVYAPNIVYGITGTGNVGISGDKQNPVISVTIPASVNSLQGKTGALTLSSGTDISIPTTFSSSNTLTITNTSTLSTVRGRGGCSGCITNDDVADDLTISSSGSLSGSAIKSGTVGTTYGGTGLTSYTKGDLIYSSASDTLAKLPIGTAGQLLTITSGIPAWSGLLTLDTTNSNVGIGTTSPLAKLSVAGSTILGSSSSDTITFTGRANSDLIPSSSGVYALGSSDLKWSQLYLTGIASIGGQSTFTSSPTGTGVGNGVIYINPATVADTSYTLFGVAVAGVEKLRMDADGNITIQGNLVGPTGGSVGYWQRSGTTLSPATSGDSIVTTGNIGIGTTSPIGTLHVVGQCVTGDTLLKRRRRRRKSSAISDQLSDDSELSDDRRLMTDDYYWEDVRIDEIKPGDEVLSLNDKTGEWQWHKVEQTLNKGIQEVTKIVTQSGKWIETTNEHPYLTIEKYHKVVPESGKFEVDLSTRMEKNTDTYVAVANKTAVEIIRITAQEKQALKKLFTKTPRLFPPTIYALCIVEILRRGKIRPSQLKICTDYPSHERDIEKVINHFYPSIIIQFQSIGRNSPAHLTVLETFRSQKKKTGAGSNLQGFPAAEQLHHEWLHGSTTHTVLMSKDYHKFTNLSMENAVWKKVKDLKPGMIIATINGWEKIQAKYTTSRKQMYDLEIEGTHNFVGNNIVAHNTYLMSGNVGVGTTSPVSLFDVNSKFNVLSGGNVGIGTTSPTSPLQVTAPTTFVSGTLSQITAPASTLTGALTGLNINISGTTPGTQSLTAFSTTAFTGGGNGSTNYGLNIGAVTGSGTSTNYGGYIGTISGGSTNNIGLRVTGTAAATANYGLYVDAAAQNYFAGNVGIGTTAPGGLLHVYGTTPTIKVGLSSGTNNPELQFVNAAGTSKAWFGIAGASNGLISGTSANDLAIRAATQKIFFSADNGTTAHMVMDTTGNVGIGTTVPLGALDVEGPANSNVVFNTGGNVGIGTTAPASPLSVTAPTTFTIGTLSQVTAPTSTLTGALTGLNINISGTTPGTQSLTGLSTTAFTGGGNGSTNYGLNIGAVTGSGTSTNYGGYIGTVSGGSTNNIGLRVTGTAAAAANYGLYVDAAAQNYFAGNVGIGTTSPGGKLDITDTSNTAASLSLTNNTATTIGNGANTLGVLDFQSTSLTTGNFLNIELNALSSGKGINLTSTSTALSSGNLFNLDWSPTGSTNIYATGDLFSIGTGNAYAYVGNLFNVKSQGSSVFSVSDTTVTSALPASFTAPGDVSIAYDINFTNPTLSMIKSQAPLTLQAGESFNSSDLTLATYNNGSVVLSQDNQPTAAGTSYALQILPTLTSSTNSLTYTGQYSLYNVPTVNLTGTSGTVTSLYNSYQGLTATAGTVTNWYGSYIAAPTGSGTVTNKFAFVSESGAGNVGINTTSPASPLVVTAPTTFTIGTLSQVTAPASTLTGALTGLNINISGTTPGTQSLTALSTTAFTGGGDGSTNYGLNIGNVTGSGTSTNYGGYIGTISGGSTNNIGLRVTGTAAAAANYGLYVDAAAQNYFAGNVGIGTTSPGAKLDVSGGINLSATGNIVGQNSMSIGKSSNTIAFNDNDQNFSNAGAYTFKYSTTQTLKIGQLAQSFLNISGAAFTSYGLAYGINFNTESRAQANDETLYGLYINPNLNSNSFTGITKYSLYNNSTANSYFAGNVGIGTTAPSSPLQITAPTTFTIGTLSQVTAPASTLTGALTGLNINISGTTPGTQSLTAFSTTAFTGGGNGSTNYGLNIGAVTGSGTSTNYGGYIGTISGGSTNNIGLRVTGTAAAAANYGLYVDAAAQNYFAGNVGIGTTGPAALLEVGSSATRGNLKITGSSSIDPVLQLNGTTQTGGKNWGLYSILNSGFQIYNLTDDSLNPKFVVTNAGNVGIGTTSPLAKLALSLTDATPTGFGFLAQNTGETELITNAVDRNFSGAGNWTGTNWAIATEKLQHTAGETADAVLANANLTASTILASRSYTVVFTVSGRTAGSVTPKIGAAAGTSVSSDTTSTQTIIAAADNANLIFTPSSDFDGSIDDISVKRVINNIALLNNGNVGIGTTSPLAQLDIASGATFSRVNAGDTQFTNTSSRELKENFNLISYQGILEKMSNVPVYTYDYISGSKDKLGIVAEDFYTVFGRGKDTEINGQEVQMALWLGVQELDSKIENLKLKIDQLESTQSALIAKVYGPTQPSAISSQSSDNQASSSASLITDDRRLTTELTDPSTLLASASASATLTTPISLTSLTTSEATISSQLVAYNLTTQNIFKSLGETFLGTTTIAGDLNIDGLLSISDGNKINTLGTLFLQSAPLADKIDIFNGLIVLEKDGTFKAQKISLPGNVLGEGTIPAGQTEIIISSSSVTNKSKIFLTPLTSTGGQSLIMSSLNPSSGFTVKLDQAFNKDIKFNWMIMDQR